MIDASQVSVRPFEPDDAEAVSTLIATTMRQSNSRDYPADRLDALIAYFTPEKLRALALERDCLVAIAGARLVGTAARDGRELATFFVLPEWQGRGIGSILLEHLEQRASMAGIRQLQVDASLTGVLFYEKRGYRRTGQVLAGTAGPQITLTKSLGAPAG